MPLLPGWSKVIISKNIRTLCKETGCNDTKRHAANIAIALSKARTEFSLRGTGPMPSYLRPKGRKGKRRG